MRFPWHVGKDAADEVLERRHDYVIKGDALAEQHGKHLVVDLAILDLLEEPRDRIAINNGTGRKGRRSQHEAVDTVTVAAAGADDETIRKRVCARDIDRVQVT